MNISDSFKNSLKKNKWKKRLPHILRESFLWLEAWIIPPTCVHCGSQRHKSLPLCRTCLRVIHDSLVLDEEVMPLPWVHALFRLTPPLQSLIHGFKYKHYRRHIRFVAAYLRYRPAFVDRMRNPDLLVPVPLHSARRRERGYNQAALIALETKKRFDLSMRFDALHRIRFTSTQTRLSGEQRAKNLTGAFRCIPSLVESKKILLVDDVCTTGSTLDLCRQELFNCGASDVGAFVIAWVEIHRRA